MSIYKAIGFDYGGVIGGVDAVGGSFTKSAGQLLNIDEATYKDLYFSLNNKINLGEVDNWREFWGLFLNKLGKPEMLDQLATLSNDAFKRLLIVEPQMLTLIDKLRANGYKVGLLSNATLENGRQMRKLGVHNHFDSFLISAEIKLMKPDPKAFGKLAYSLGVNMTELIFVDDAERSLSTAEDCGFTPVLFKSYPDLVRQLEALNMQYSIGKEGADAVSDLKVTAKPGIPLIITERSFNAAREKVFAAFIEKDKLERWWVPAPGYQIRIEKLEARAGGQWRFINIDEKTSQEFVFHGSYHEVTTPERIIWTFELEPMPKRGHVSLECFEFINAGESKTIVRSTTSFLSVADRDWMTQSGTEEGLEKSYGLLDKVLRS